MTGSGPKLGVLLLIAVLLQTVVVIITVLHFTTTLNSVRKRKVGDAWGFLRVSVQCAARVCAKLFGFSASPRVIRLFFLNVTVMI